MMRKHVLVLAALAVGLLSASASAQTLTTLHSFTGYPSDGYQPFAGLISDANGALYGTTAGGGAYNQGAVYKLTPPSVSGGRWAETVLYSFSGGFDGANPNAGLISDAAGALYGTTFTGGGSGYGTVFVVGRHEKLTP